MELSREEIDFLKEIEANLDDDSARLVYADWLEERGDDRSEYLRLELELSSGSGTIADRETTVARVQELNAAIDPDWLSLVSRSAIEGCYTHLLENRGCPGRWRSLKKTESPKVRLCENCEKAIHFCTSVSKARWFRAVAQQKVTLESTLERQVDDIEPQYPEESNLPGFSVEPLRERVIAAEKIALAAFGNSKSRSWTRWFRSPE